MAKIAVTLATFESKLHDEHALWKGVELYNAGCVEYEKDEDGGYRAVSNDAKEEQRFISLRFTRDGSDLEHYSCGCNPGRNGSVCKHIVATVLSIQGGIVDTPIVLGKSAKVSTTVIEHNTAQAVGSGSLDVFATPMMIALMEQAACNCLADGLESGQTSVGTGISVEHTAASLLGAKITATATITSVNGRKIEFEITASDSEGQIGKGTHTRVIVDSERFLTKAGKRV